VLYLSGHVRKGWPAMLTERTRQMPPDGQPWAADNGCFTQPQAYSDAGYLSWLARMEPYRHRCLFATAPDVVGDAEATLDRSLPMLPRIRDAGYPVALVAQDGLAPGMVPWDDIDALFIGGSTTWKLSEASHDLCVAAKSAGKWLHMGRVNSGRRYELARSFGCDSADGTFLAFGPDVNEPRAQAWLDRTARQPTIWRVER
jgi:hypothetical protein